MKNLDLCKLESQHSNHTFKKPVWAFWKYSSFCCNMKVLTLEKHAPIWTFGVGGSPLLTGRGGVCRFLSLRLGGTGGVSERRSGSGPEPNPSPKIYLHF